jgi:hypothetical protein
MQPEQGCPTQFGFSQDHRSHRTHDRRRRRKQHLHMLNKAASLLVALNDFAVAWKTKEEDAVAKRQTGDEPESITAVTVSTIQSNRECKLTKRARLDAAYWGAVLFLQNSVHKVLIQLCTLRKFTRRILAYSWYWDVLARGRARIEGQCRATKLYWSLHVRQSAMLIGNTGDALISKVTRCCGSFCSLYKDFHRHFVEAIWWVNVLQRISACHMWRTKWTVTVLQVCLQHCWQNEVNSKRLAQVLQRDDTLLQILCLICSTQNVQEENEQLPPAAVSLASEWIDAVACIRFSDKQRPVHPDELMETARSAMREAMRQYVRKEEIRLRSDLNVARDVLVDLFGELQQWQHKRQPMRSTPAKTLETLCERLLRAGMHIWWTDFVQSRP